MKYLIFLYFLLFNILASAEIMGVGATFPQPVLNAWMKDYKNKTNFNVTYKGLGSAEGIKRITARAIDFAVTDIPLTESELRQDDLIQIPLVSSGIVPVINLPLPKDTLLKLSGSVLAEIFLGTITRWNDPKITEINPNLELPNLEIKVIHREEGSGTTFTFTHYLSKVSSLWNSSLGIGSRIKWPTGAGVTGNDGIGSRVSQTIGAIGYVEYLSAQKFQLSMVSLLNVDGNYVNPSMPTFDSAFRKAKWNHSNFYQMLTNPPGDNSWPIMGTSYLLIHKSFNNQADLEETLKFINWIYSQGNTIALENNYFLIQQEPVLGKIKSELNSVSIKRLKGNN